MKKAIIGLMAIACVTFTSCEKESGDSLKKDLLEGSIEDVVVKEMAIEDAVEAADYEVDYFTGISSTINEFKSLDEEVSLKGHGKVWFGKGRYKDGEGPTVTKVKTDGGYPVVVTVDYGDGLVLKNGREISGKVIINVSAKPRTDGAIREITYDNYVVDSIKIAGSVKKVYAANDTDNFVKITGERTLQFFDGSTITRSIEKTKKWIAGIDTKYDSSDDIKHIDGFVLSVTSEGDEYKKSITKTLVKKGGCRYLVEGIVEVSKDGEVVSVVDYGDGTCDNIATLTKDGETKEIELRKWRGKGKNKDKEKNS